MPLLTLVSQYFMNFLLKMYLQAKRWKCLHFKIILSKLFNNLMIKFTNLLIYQLDWQGFFIKSSLHKFSNQKLILRHNYKVSIQNLNHTLFSLNKLLILMGNKVFNNSNNPWTLFVTIFHKPEKFTFYPDHLNSFSHIINQINNKMINKKTGIIIWGVRCQHF